MWIFDVFFNKELKAREAKRRKLFIEENNNFIENLRKLKLLKSQIGVQNTEDIKMIFIDSININKLIQDITAISHSYNLILISPSQADKMRTHVHKVRHAVTNLIYMSKITEKIDGFFETENSKDSIFSKKHNNSSAIDSFERV